MCKRCHTVRIHPSPSTRFRVYGLRPGQTATLLGVFQSLERARAAAATVDEATIVEDSYESLAPSYGADIS